MEKAHLAKLQTHSKQGEVARIVGPALAARFTRLRQEQRTQLFLFLLRAVAQLLPTPDTLLQRAEDRRRDNLLCQACHRHRIASSRHALTCPALIPMQLRLHKRVRKLLRLLIAPALLDPSLSPERRNQIRLLPQHLHWYKPYRTPQPPSQQGQHPGQQGAPRSDPAPDPSAHQTLLDKVNAYDRYCGVLGFLPPELIKLAYPSTYWATLPDHAYRATRSHIDNTMKAIQRHLLRAAQTSFMHWLRLQAPV